MAKTDDHRQLVDEATGEIARLKAEIEQLKAERERLWCELDSERYARL